MSLGPLNRRGILYLNTPSIEEGGVPQDSLSPLRNLPLTVVEGDDAKDETVGERLSSDCDIQWRTRWFDGLKEKMFIVSEGRTYRITRCKEIGRREGWHIWAQDTR